MCSKVMLSSGFVIAVKVLPALDIIRSFLPNFSLISLEFNNSLIYILFTLAHVNIPCKLLNTYCYVQRLHDIYGKHRVILICCGIEMLWHVNHSGNVILSCARLCDVYAEHDVILMC